MASNEVLTVRTNTDYSKCSLCQLGSCRDQGLRRPYKRKQDHGSYGDIEIAITDLVSKNIPLPFGLNTQCLNDGSGIEQTLLTNEAFFHHTCRERLRKLKDSDQSTKSPVDEEPALSPKKLRKDFNASLNCDDPRCVKCCANEEEDLAVLIKGSSKAIGKSLWEYANEANDYVVIARLYTSCNPTDAVAADIFYHDKCKLKMFNAAERSKNNNKPKATNSVHWFDPLLFAQVVADVKYSCDMKPVQLSQLIKLYKDRFKHLHQIDDDFYIHETRFLEKMLDLLGSGFSSFRAGKFIMISKDAKTGEILNESLNNPITQSEAMKIVEVGLIMHRKYVNKKQPPFKGNFPPNCMLDSVDRPLMTLVDVAMHGTNTVLGKSTQE